MDSYRNFVDRFKRAASDRDFGALPSILKDGQQCLNIVSLEYCELAVSSIFDRRDGLLYFLKCELRQHLEFPNRNIDYTFTEAFKFLTFIIQNFCTTSCFVQYIHQIKNACQVALTVKHSSSIQKAACDTFTELIKSFKDHDLHLVQTVKHFVGLLNLYKPKERRFLYCVVGKIVKYDESVYSWQKELERIFEFLRSDQEDSKNKAYSDMYFDALSDMLDKVEPPNGIKEKLFYNMYESIKDFSLPNRPQRTTPKILKSAINLLNRHMNLFQHLLYPDYKHWHDTLRHLSLTTTSGAYGQDALKRFYRIIGQILTSQNNEDSRVALVYFLEHFHGEFENPNLDLITLKLNVYGFSQMAAPCKVHMNQLDIRNMYSIITSYALPLCFSEKSDATHVENVCSYQEALSEMLRHMTDVTIEKVNVLVKLSIYTIKRFPDLVIPNSAVSALTRTISNLGSINKGLLQQYLDNIIYDGVAWSCSHTLAVDVELQRELNNLEQSPICYKNYLTLWTKLLDAEKYYADEQLAQYVANTMMDKCIALINRLDIRVKQTSEDTVLSDVALTQSAVNQADFRVFANLVDLYVDVIDASEPSLFANTVHRFLYEVVRLSYRHPLISGFYKLIRAGMKIFAHTSEEEGEESAESRQMKMLLSNYLWYTIDLIPAFSHELLIACLYLILDAPFAYVEDALPRTLTAFKIAFTVGLSNLELAYTALAALETWTTTATAQKRDERANELLREIVGSLEPYLRSTESSVEISQDLTKATARKRVKRVDVIDTECTLRNFQRRVLLFFGSLDHDLLTSFAYERASRNTGASWDRKDLLKYSLPMPDARPDIHFDRMLPRIIALACDSSDRRTKIAACEVLHSVVALVIGSTARFLSDPENRFMPLYGTLCQAVLALGCDPDEVVCDLFHPLALQLMRWLSIRLMSTSPVIDSLFDGLTDVSNPALREFSGRCLAEFTSYSIRQADTRMTPHVQRVIERISNLALHPSKRKRIAAAVAFNHLYAILREDDDLVSIYWLEIFYCFVRSLDGCDDPSITNALAHVEKVMRVKADVLNIHCDNRRKPHEFGDATLDHALYWLLSQCGTLDEHCRARCMELYVSMSQYVGRSAQTYVETYGIRRLNDIILRGLESDVEDISAASNVTPLLKALDYYVWLIDRRLLPVETLFLINNVNQTIFSRIRSFARQFLRAIAGPSAGTAATPMKSRELEQLQALQCKTLMTALNFVQVLLNVKNVHYLVQANVLPESLWDESFSALTIKCIMHPRTVGFDVKNIEITDKLPRVLETLLNSMRLRYSYALPDTFKKYRSRSVQKYAEQLFDLRDNVQNNTCDDLIQHLNGLILLERCELLDRTEMSTFANGEDTVMRIFNFLVNERIGELACKDLGARMVQYLRALMEFQLSLHSSTIDLIPDDVRSMTETLVNHIFDVTPVTGVDCMQITHGEHFLNTFKDAIFRYMLTHVGAVTLVFDVKSRENPSLLLRWIEDLLLFLKRHARELRVHVDTAVDAILRQFTCLESAVYNVDSRKERLLNIYGTAVRLKSRPAEVMQNREFHQWILSRLADSNDLEYKTKILKNFLVCLTDATDRNDRSPVWTIALGLKTYARDLCSNLSETSVNAMKVIDCFETLLTLLSETKSMMTLECVIHFAAGAGNRLFDEKLEKHLREYYYGASVEHALQSLELTYGAFNKAERTETERFDIMHGFLLPTFKFCDVAATERFFQQNYQDLKTIANLSFAAEDDDAYVKHNIVSKIGCFQLIATICVRMDIDKVVDVNDGKKIASCNELLKIAAATRSSRIRRPGCGELARLLCCSAYNCTLAIASVREGEDLYEVPFGDKTNKSFTWANIIDCDKPCSLGQTFKEYPKARETTVNIRSTGIDGDGRQMHRYAYVHSYDLSASTLSEDINAYDLNKCVVLPFGSRHPTPARNSADYDPRRTHDATSVAWKSDDFNEHECMPYICVLLRRFREIFGSRNDVPKWLKFFLRSIPQSNQNIQLFMLKIISNTDEVFKPCARSMLGPIIKAITNYLERYDLNYIVTDVLEILLNWHEVAVPSEQANGAEARRLFEVLVDKVLIKKSGDNNRVYSYNLGLVRTMVGKWRGCLRVPGESLSRKMTSAPAAAVYLILVLLDNDMTEGIVARNDIVDFLLGQLRNWDAPSTDETPLQCCECFGLYLRSLEGRDDAESKRCEVKSKIFGILGSLSVKPSHVPKQMKRIAALCRTYPDVAVDYINITISAMAKCLARSYCLEIFALSIPGLSAEDVVGNLRHMTLESILKNQVQPCEKMALRIVRDMVATVPLRDLEPYVRQAIPYVKDNITEHRELVYDMLMKIYNRYSEDIAADNDGTVRELLAVSVRSLLAGLRDPSHDLQDRILRFWTEETNLGTERSRDRLVDLLNMHSPQMTAEGDAFATFVALLMLQLATKSIDYTRKMFDAPLQDGCTFEDYRIAVSWRRQNLSCMTPMFVDSLASQMSYGTFSQSVDNDLSGTMAPSSFSRGPPRLRATQDLQFDPTPFDGANAADAAVMLDISSPDRSTVASSSGQSPQATTTPRRRFSRILANTSDVTNSIRRRQIQKNMQRAEMIKQENVRQRSSVRLYRNYKIGEFPDIEISHASLIVPLQQLVKLDWPICKDVTVSLLYSLIKEIIEREKSDDFCRTIVDRLKRILHDSSEEVSSFNTVILETLLQLSRDAATIADCNPRDIVKVSKANRLNALGALLLERSLLPDARDDDDDDSPTSSKRMRRRNDDICNEETNKWAQLASLYKSLNDVDVVLSIFRRRRSFGQDIQKAALAEVDGDWARAKDAFSEAYGGTNDSSIKEHCLQGLLEATNNLCDWSEIDRLVKNRTDSGRLKDIWNDAWRDWMIPYTCDAYVHMLEEKSYEDLAEDMGEEIWTSSVEDREAVALWMSDRDKLRHLMLMTGENLVIFLLEVDTRKATDLLNDLLDMLGKQWVGLSPLCTELGIRELLKLQTMNDLDASLKILRSANEAESLDRMDVLLDFWSTKAPTSRDDLIQWNKLAAYRGYFSALFKSHISREDDDRDTHRRKRKIIKRLHEIDCRLQLGIVDAALNQKHRYIPEKHLHYMSRLEKYVSLELPSAWLEARIKCLCADLETDMCKKVSDYTASWERSHQLLSSDRLNASASIAVRKHIGTMASKLESLSRENGAFASALTGAGTTILRDIGITELTGAVLDDVREQLLRYSLRNLQSCCGLAAEAAASNVGEHYCALAKHCYGRLTSTDAESDEIFQEFLSSTLSSMRHDYLEATHYFPCLLRPERLRNDETRETFVRECARLRPWLFLRWRDLLFSHLETPSVATAIVPIIERLAETYPDAVVYTYRLTVERNPDILQNEKFQRIRSLLRGKAAEYERFLRAIQCVVQSELYLKHYLDEAMRDLSRGKATVIEIIESLHQKISDFSTYGAGGRNPRPDDILNKIMNENEIRALNPNDGNAAQEEIRRLKISLDSRIRCASKNARWARKLKDYSPFLHEYVGGGIEIPGQYTGDREPTPRYHVRIARFEPHVEVMRSLRRPIRIGMVGENGREYKFLVKFGEDLTIDRGLQQLFSTMNRTLRNDPGCRQRRLTIDTYEVIPLSSSFGLIQWVGDTRSLEDMVRFPLSKESDRCDSIRQKYVEWMRKAAPTRQRVSDQYKAAASKYNQRQVTEYMKCLIGETKRTALRDAFDAISPSPECFVTLRRNFVASYATMCAAHWLAGVGDRHLQNTLVHVSAGRCLGIDFGHAFGSGVRAPIPELVPFRLTPQILELLRPFTERDLLATIMTHVMRALRDGRGPILACMDIFIHKPVHRALSINDDGTMWDGNEEIDADLTWSSKKNIETVAKKLKGIHPSVITLEQLKETHDDEYFPRYRDIVTGNDGLKQARAEIRSDYLTPAEQVDCLLDQAKDLNILGRMYANWQPWL